jgi:molybdopterin synthase catalytic subunit
MHLINGPVPAGTISDIIAKAGENHESGAHSLFLGQVRRDNVNGKFVRAIDYSAYEEMVVKEADKIIKSLLSEFNDVRSIDIFHSKGLVTAGGISLLVVVSAGHRPEALNACAKAVELVKANLPFWKKEIFEDDSEQWRENG